jgi:signal transduction histidine kinase
MVVVFQTVTLEGWTDIMYTVDSTSELSLGWLYFVLVAFFAGLFVVQLLLAVITKSYSDVAAEERAELSADIHDWLGHAITFWMRQSPLTIQMPNEQLVADHFEMMMNSR